MKLKDQEEPLYFKTDASGFGLGASLLQVRKGMNHPTGEAPDNTILWTIPFDYQILSLNIGT